jgi:hypothetical protein
MGGAVLCLFPSVGQPLPNTDGWRGNGNMPGWEPARADPGDSPGGEK